MGLDRRDFLKLTAALSTLAALPAGIAAATPANDRLGPVVPARPLGRTGLDVSMFAIGGGSHAADYHRTPEIIEAAMQHGCRFFETARMYGGGRCEVEWGKHLTPKYRDDVVLLSKSTARDGRGFTKDIETSLRNMKTDAVDVYLIHNITSVDDADRRLRHGVHDAALAAKQAGKIKHIGFSAHARHAAADHLIDQHLPELDVALIPVNIVDPARASFVLNTLPKAHDAGLGVLGMKVLGGGGLVGQPITWSEAGDYRRGTPRRTVIPDLVSLDEALGFAWSLPIASATLGCTSADHVRADLDAARRFTALSADQRQALVARVADLAAHQQFEHYKARNQ